MAANLFPVDAVTGAPSYTGRMARQTLGGLWLKSPSRLLGARTGIHPATLGATIVTATSTTWTVLPHTGVLDLEANAIAGPYDYSFDANVTGSVTAADATNQRVDSLFVQLSDPAEGDGTSAPVVAVVYVAGTPGTAGGARGAAGGPPNFPNTRCMELSQITVPKSGGGSPVVSMVAPFASTAGGALLLRTFAELAGLSAVAGMTATCLDNGFTYRYGTDSKWHAQAGTITYNDAGTAQSTINSDRACTPNRTITNPFGAGIGYRVKITYQVAMTGSGSGNVTIWNNYPTVMSIYAVVFAVAGVAISGITTAEVDMPNGGATGSFAGGLSGMGNTPNYQTYTGPAHFIQYEVSPL